MRPTVDVELARRRICQHACSYSHPRAFVLSLSLHVIRVAPDITPNRSHPLPHILEMVTFAAGETSLALAFFDYFRFIPVFYVYILRPGSFSKRKGFHYPQTTSD